MVGVLGGFCTRLVVTAVVLASLAPMKGIDRPSLALSGIVLIAVTLGFQSWQVSRIPGYFWVTPASAADGNKRTHP
jgi:hypothetical protein